MSAVLAARGLCGARGGTPDTPGWLALEDGRITDAGTGPPPTGAEDLGDVTLAPGFLDLQVNGVGTVDFGAASLPEWGRALDALASQGVTACCPTLVTAPLDDYPAILDRAGRAQTQTARPARPAMLGVHLEGPFLGGAPGAHRPDLIRPADPAWLAEVLDRYPGLVRIVTLAPEADPGFVATRLLAGRGVVVALGHSTADYTTSVAAADAGARLVTHLFNGMGPLHHREPGLAGAALDDARLTPSLIADLVHVHPAALRLAIRAKRAVALVTDAVAVAAGEVGGFRIHEEGGAARLADGTLAGALLSMDAAVRNVVGLGVPLPRAIEMASTIPAEVLGLDDRGRLEPGTRADLVALDRETLAVRGVWVAGVRALG